MKIDFIIGNNLVEQEKEKTQENTRILQEYYERSRKANEGKGKENA